MPGGRNRNLRRLFVSLVSAQILFADTLTVDSGDTPIHNGSWSRISILICEWCVGGEEACVMSLSTDDDRQLRSIWLLGVSKGLKSFDHLWVLFFNDGVELSF